MARPLRIEFARALDHVTARGNMGNGIRVLHFAFGEHFALYYSLAG